MEHRAFKRSLHHSERYKPPRLRSAEEGVRVTGGGLSERKLIANHRENGYELRHWPAHDSLAKPRFWWGGKRAVAMAYENPTSLPTKRSGSPTRSSHNPSVNGPSARDERYVSSRSKMGQGFFRGGRR